MSPHSSHLSNLKRLCHQILCKKCIGNNKRAKVLIQLLQLPDLAIAEDTLA